MDIRIGVKKLEKPIPLEKPFDAFEMIQGFKEMSFEVVSVLHVDGDHKMFEIEVAAIGSMMSVSVESRSIFRHAVEANDGRSIIVAHNHAFQRKAEPSEGDREFTSGIRSGGHFLGVPLLDALVLGTESFFSALAEGYVFPKTPSYTMVKKPEIPPAKGPSVNPKRVLVTGGEPVTAPKKSLQYLEFLRKEKEETTAILHLTPDLEVRHMDVFPTTVGPDWKQEASNIFRHAILSPYTKYVIVANNHGCRNRKAHLEESLTERIHQIRFGGMVLCIPAMDVIVLNDRGYYSFAEHGDIFPKSKFYTLSEVEVLRLPKGVNRTPRPDIPPYAWTLR